MLWWIAPSERSWNDEKDIGHQKARFAEYAVYDRLQELNMTHFDCWASRFGETVTALELAPEGYTLVGR